MIILQRECNWKDVLYRIENEMKIVGTIYFVVFVELFSGKFKIESVETKNKYFQEGYVSTFFDKVDFTMNTKGIFLITISIYIF